MFFNEKAIPIATSLTGRKANPSFLVTKRRKSSSVIYSYKTWFMYLRPRTSSQIIKTTLCNNHIGKHYYQCWRTAVSKSNTMCCTGKFKLRMWHFIANNSEKLFFCSSITLHVAACIRNASINKLHTNDVNL